MDYERDEEHEDLKHNLFVFGVGALLIGGALIAIHYFQGGDGAAEIAGGRVVAIAKDYAAARPEVVDDLAGVWIRGSGFGESMILSREGVIERESGTVRALGTYEVLSPEEAAEILGAEEPVKDIVLLEKMKGNETHYLVNFTSEREISLTPLPDGETVRYQRVGS